MCGKQQQTIWPRTLLARKIVHQAHLLQVLIINTQPKLSKKERKTR